MGDECKVKRTCLGLEIKIKAVQFDCVAEGGKECKLPYRCENNYGFRKHELEEFAWAYKISDVMRAHRREDEQEKITTKEVRKCLTRLGEDPTDKEYLEILNNVDAKADGVLNFQDFVKLMREFDRSCTLHHELVEAFALFDTDMSGKIDAV